MEKIIFKKISEFAQKHIGDINSFICVYGSYASGNHSVLSDLDIFIAAEKHEPYFFDVFKSFLLDIHERYGLNTDDEVPYENKIIVSYQDVLRAVQLKPFTLNSRKSLVVPPVEKTKEFLSSDGVRWRLILNALTSPHVCLYGNHVAYEDFVRQAESAIVKLARSLCSDNVLDETQLLESLLASNRGHEGENYLGYKRERESVVKHLKDIIERHI
ncbi:TPA: hypothetical protein DEW47_03690 [Patescibacteria group bacterium]|nr:MAG: hypothetical protein UT71_C0018G0007 [Parcubacteria group bacterium GW2011_GWF2_40_10]KKR46707.1 MAG: hypothetical protein UT83_C0019G0008 [Parcubacteria group bacterium GW2011_GWA2_40_143]KKR59391.1 MAG: hypothetical protein UT97_C0015G0008 [Parcubacteria group bacterium GW2011_GWC2_40_31]KKR74434.1 MAG: hypothetical protein UU18_C0028G0002 [Parcubacteria group bacterium GW2011_GWB2_40_8]KKR75967.1 MAG: hypothetical protein UU20_C0037G0008 [Parcubacteria group bacterium GW2011_GWE2_40_